MRQGTDKQSVLHTYHYPLDLMRFAAASSVVAFHLAFYAWASHPGSSAAHAFQGAASFVSALPWTWFGWVGVEIFFVISGFVIANSAAGASPGGFLKGRVLRLLPAAWICATITLLVRGLGGADRLESLIGPYLTSMTLAPVGPWIDGVYWSLAVEIIFYALVFGLLQFRAIRFLPVVAWLLMLWSAAFLLLTESHLYWRIPGWRYITLASEPLLLRHGAFFAAGIWLWLWSERRLRVSGALGLCLAVAAGWLEIWMRGESLQGAEAPAAAGQPLMLPILVWTCVVAVLLVVTRWPAAFAPRSKAVGTWLRRIGLATYPLYLVHDVVGVTLMRAMILAGAPKWLALALAVAAVAGVAFLVALVFEPRLRRVFRRTLERSLEGRASPGGGAVAPAP